MWLLYFAVGLYVIYSFMMLTNAFKYHNLPIGKYNAKPLFVIAFAQVALIPLMVKYF